MVEEPFHHEKKAIELVQEYTSKTRIISHEMLLAQLDSDRKGHMVELKTTLEV